MFVIVAVLIYLVGRRFIKKKEQYYSKKQQLLRQFNKTEITESGILLRWNVYFDYETPFIADLTAFCTRHDGPPLRFIHNHCPVSGCENSRNTLNEYALKNAIESDLIDRWEKIK